jgi:hypothetical protein
MSGQPTVESVVFVIDDAAVRASLKSLFKSVGLYVTTERPPCKQ